MVRALSHHRAYSEENKTKNVYVKNKFKKRHLSKETEDALTFGPGVFSLVDCRHSVLVHWRGLKRLRNNNQALDKNE